MKLGQKSKRAAESLGDLFGLATSWNFRSAQESFGDQVSLAGRTARRNDEPDHRTNRHRTRHSRNATGRCAREFTAAKGAWSLNPCRFRKYGEGEVLFRVAACGICGTDIKKIHHGFLAPPQILGHELAGTVVKVGAGVTKFKPGDRVVSFHHIPCGACFYCEQKLFSQCAGYKKVGLTAGFDPNGGGFAEYVRAMPWIVERGMILLPPDVTFEEATFVEPVNTCLKAVRKARVATGETVLVIGQGPIGMLLMILAKLEGATVYTSDPMAGRRAASVRFGAAESFDPAREQSSRGNSRANG